MPTPAPCQIDATEYPLSLAQEQRLMVEELATRAGGQAPSNCFPLAFVVPADCDIASLQAAYEALIARHAVLRATFAATAHPWKFRAQQLFALSRGGPLAAGLYHQDISRLAPTCRLDIRDVDDRDASLAAIADAVATEQSAASFSIAAAPLMRLILLRVGGTPRLLIVVFSHLIADGWTTEVVRRDLSALHMAFRRQRPSELPALRLHHPDLAAMEQQKLRSAGFEREQEFWTTHWAAAEPAQIRLRELPFARTGARQAFTASGRVSVACVSLSAEETIQARQVMRALHITPYLFFRTAATIVLHRYTGRPLVALWANFLNRRWPGSESIMGWCSTTHILTTDVSRNPSWPDLCGQIERSIEVAQPHEALSLAGLKHLTGCSFAVNDTKIGFEIERYRGVGSAELRRVPVAGGREWMDLNIGVRNSEHQFTFVLTHNHDKYDRDGVARMAEDLRRTVREMLTGDVTVSRLIERLERAD